MIRQVVQAGPVEALAALFDDGLPTPGPGDPLPPLWHWVALARWAAYGATGPDGHPRPLDLPASLRGRRRMFAGGRVREHRPLRVGEHVEVHEEIASMTPKQGRQGSFVLVELHSRVVGEAGDLALEEWRDLVYRAPATGPATAAPAEPPVRDPLPEHPALLAATRTGWSLYTDPVALMRFSSATANAHRIHYDWVHATRVEGYPDLVVHGPLITLSLAEVARLARPDMGLQVLEHRNRRPLFCGQIGDISLSETVSGLDLVVSHEGAQVATLHGGQASTPPG